MKWINFLHLYQPMNADVSVIKEATEKSYERIIRALEKNPKIKFTLNISGCLIVRWDELGYRGFIERIVKLLKDGRIELTGTAAYHALLPLMPVDEVKYQIIENEKILNKYFAGYKPRGFFLPEMAYSKEVARIVKSFGYEWIILDEILYDGEFGEVDFKKVYQDKNSGLKIIFRSRKLSKAYPPDVLKDKIKTDELFISATDAELYGLRHIDPTGEFEKFLENNIETLTTSEFVDSKKVVNEIKPISGSWESEPKELRNNKPFVEWQDEKNNIQKDLWLFVNFVYKTINKYKKDKNYPAARWHLDRGLASCVFWWASGRKLGIFSPLSWSPDDVERGINELIRAIRSIENKKANIEKIKAEKMSAKIREELWVKHWKQK